MNYDRINTEIKTIKMKHIFYTMIFMLAMYECAKLANCKKLNKHIKTLSGMNKLGKTWYLKAHPLLILASLIDLFGLVLLGIGLFSSQWLCFLIVMVLSFSQFQKLGAWAICLDSLVTIVVYLFAILNTYYFHLILI